MEVGFDNRQAAFDMVSTMLDKRQRRKILYLGSKTISVMSSVITATAMR